MLDMTRANTRERSTHVEKHSKGDGADEQNVLRQRSLRLWARALLVQGGCGRARVGLPLLLREVGSGGVLL